MLHFAVTASVWRDPASSPSSPIALTRFYCRLLPARSSAARTVARIAPGCAGCIAESRRPQAGRREVLRWNNVMLGQSRRRTSPPMAAQHGDCARCDLMPSTHNTVSQPRVHRPGLRRVTPAPTAAAVRIALVDLFPKQAEADKLLEESVRVPCRTGPRCRHHPRRVAEKTWPGVLTAVPSGHDDAVNAGR